MTKRYTTMTKADVREIQEAMFERIREWAADKGLNVEGGGGTFDPSGIATLKIKVSLVNEDPSAVPSSLEAVAFRQLCRMYGFVESDLGRKVRLQGDWYQIIGLKSRSSKKPILLRSVSDPERRIVAATDYVRLSLERSTA